MNDQRNMILAIALSALVLFGWTILSDRYFPTPKAPVAVAAPATRTTNPALANDYVAPTPASVPGAEKALGIRDRAVVLAETPRIVIDTPRLAGSINLRGARLDDLVLKQYRETIQRTSPPVRLFTPSGAPASFFSQFGWSGTDTPPGDALWTANAPRLTPATPVTLSYAAATGTVFEIVLAIDDNYMFTATQRVRNVGAAPITVRPWGLVARVGEGNDKDIAQIHVGPIGVFGDRLKDSEVGYSTLRDDGPQRFTTTGGWLGITDKYWGGFIIPDQKTPIAANFAAASGNRFQADFLAGPVTVAPGQTVATVTRLFAGAKEVNLIERYKAAFGIPLFDRAVSWGYLWFLTQPIFHILDWLFKLTGNFGVAIIGLTFIVKAAMFPIANKQYASMARMRIVQPKMKEIQDKFKDDKQRQQTEMMALYKKEKVNPVAGCLPIFLQIPIFYALYKTLLVSTEMRHQPFVLWIRDLSAADPVTPINLFGLLPFQPPALIAVGVLPILVGVSMWLQMRLNPPVADPIQQQVFKLMPWVLTFIMAPFAAGLQVYWITNNLLSVAQQWWMLKRHPMPATPAVVK